VLALDSNLLLYAANEDCPEHAASRAFVTSLSGRTDVAISEFILVELYLLVRNPVVFNRPLDAHEAAALIGAYRRHPRWMLVGWPESSTRVHEVLWKAASAKGFPRRRIIDQRMAIMLLEQGVREFATANVRDFKGLGFERVWNPLA